MLENIVDLMVRECRLDRTRPLLAGISGGPDSLCLLDLLQRAGYPLIVAHFDHQLRPESGEDARAVRALAEARGLPYEQGAADVAEHARRNGMGIEEAARALRYRFLFGAAVRHGAQAVAVGHTADDQAETILMHILRGTGLDGLTGMSARALLPEYHAFIPVVRPLLGIWRAQTEDYCAAAGLQPRIDPSNASREYLRNRLRHELIPTMETYNPRFREALVRMARALDGDAQFLDEIAAAVFADCLARGEDDLLVLDAAALASRPLPVQRRVLRIALRRLDPGLRDVDFEAIERATDCLAGRTVRAELTGGAWMLREGAQVYLAVRDAQLPSGGWPQLGAGSLRLDVPGEARLPDGWRLRAERLPCDPALRERAQSNGDPFQAFLDNETVGALLEVRPMQAGDRFRPLGMPDGSIKLSDFFVNVKLPQRARAGWPLVCARGEIAWLPGFRPGETFRLRAETRQVVYLVLSKED